MKLLFAHDHVFYKFEETFYSTGGLSKKMLERYTSSFENVTVVSRQKKLEEYNSNLTVSSHENIEFVEIKDFKSLKKIKFIFEAKKEIEKKVKENDFVIARLPSSIGNLAINYAIKHNKPYLVEVVACPFDAYWNRGIIGKIIALPAYFSMRNKVFNSKHTIYVTNSFLQKRYPTKGEQTNCSNVSLISIDNSTLISRIKKINNMPKDQRIVLGTIAAVNVPHKGQEAIIKALGKLNEQGIDKYEYQLVGGGSTEYLKSIAKKYNVEQQVVFLGTLPHKKIFEWLETIDIYTQPSKQEGLPRALIETMSMAVPAFGANTAGIPELLDEKYIFEYSSTTTDEIINILSKYDENLLLEQSKQNFENSKQYAADKIDVRRNQFFNNFKGSK